MCSEFLSVLTVSTVVSTFVLQFFGFFTPYWACDLNAGASSCLIHGLFSFCPTSSDCRSQVLSEDILGLCATCFTFNCVVILFVLWRVYQDMKKYGKLDFEVGKNGITIVTIWFFIGQFFSGIAAVILLSRYDVMGWSAVLFTTLSLPVFAIVALVAGIALIVCCGAMYSKD